MAVYIPHLNRRFVIFQKLLKGHNVADLPMAHVEKPPMRPATKMNDVINRHDALKKRLWGDMLRTADIGMLRGAAESLKQRDVKRENKAALAQKL